MMATATLPTFPLLDLVLRLVIAAAVTWLGFVCMVVILSVLVYWLLGDGDNPPPIE